MRFAVAVLIAGLFASTSARAERPTTFETAGLAAAETSLIIDAMQTLQFKNYPSMTEQNPILGVKPNDTAIVGYCAGAMLLTAAVWYVLPKHIRNVVPVAVLALEIPVISHNATNLAFESRGHNGQRQMKRGLSIQAKF